jgi:hypothetical protein
MSIESFLKEAALADRGRKRARLTADATRPDATRVARKKRKAAVKAVAAPASAGTFDPRDPVSGDRLSSPVRTQPNEDRRCVAYALAAAMETWLCRANQSTANAPELSVTHTFAQGGNQELLGPTAKGVKKGVKEDACFEAGSGCADPLTKTWKGFASRVDAGDSDRPAVMRQLLRDGRVLAISVPLFTNFADFAGSGAYVATGSVIGAHALCIVGFDQPPGGQGVWIVKNSFGETWGDGGYGRIRWNDPDVEPERVVFMVERVERAG